MDAGGFEMAFDGMFKAVIALLILSFVIGGCSIGCSIRSYDSKKLEETRKEELLNWACKANPKLEECKNDTDE